MALRFQSGKLNAASIGIGAITHGLAGTPTEFALVDSGASHLFIQAASVADATYIYVTGTTLGNASIWVFASIPHTWIA